MTTHDTMRKTPTVKISPEIIISPRLHRILKHHADNLGTDIDRMLQEELTMNLDAWRDYRKGERKAAALGMSYSEYCFSACKEHGHI